MKHVLSGFGCDVSRRKHRISTANSKSEHQCRYSVLLITHEKDILSPLRYHRFTNLQPGCDGSRHTRQSRASFVTYLNGDTCLSLLVSRYHDYASISLFGAALSWRSINFAFRYSCHMTQTSVSYVGTVVSWRRHQSCISAVASCRSRHFVTQESISFSVQPSHDAYMNFINSGEWRMRWTFWNNVISNVFPAVVSKIRHSLLQN
jgi:hypothetical protein